jgi:hypothetical protein
MSEPAFERLGRGYSRSMKAAVRMRCVPSDVVRILEVEQTCAQGRRGACQGRFSKKILKRILTRSTFWMNFQPARLISRLLRARFSGAIRSLPA